MARKRWFALIPLAILVGWTAAHAKLAKERDGGNPLHLEVRSAVMMDADTGEWLYAYRGDEALPPASMSKMMTELIVLDDAAAGKLSWEDRVRVSEYAAGVTGASMGLRAGQNVTVRELFEAMAVHSANDAAVALAEYAAGSEKAFAERMNRKAKQIGLSEETVFANATGLSREDVAAFEAAAADGETEMSAKDAARLAVRLIRTHPELLETTKLAFAPRTDSQAALQTTNEMLPGQRFGTAGNDGLKTGYTGRAGYCFTGTTMREGKRLVTVVMGTSTPEARFEETRKLLEYGWEKVL
ncbi:D-alanyl-D-alanine carboxypeptidase family protein [Cohnella candidum]|uniref:D-alanyl-D-alanine carboxypeptidase n=1 Tax=Cohnella candidum TaxID=2674991 RepID=A0A3G3JY76_9BACL|nr:D-alanyl-D-alanine carboxypeptidase family protein [Cohnella candidum]AYQ72807.1 D-alanyl-D-alanine carboxypeptidase [Cohnella candidum]